MAEECWVCYGIAKRRKGEDSMSKANFQRVLTLKLYEVLYEESDEEHGLSLAEIRESLTLRGYPCDLRTVRLALQALWNAGYDIQKEFKYPRNLYTLLDRPFDVAELQILADAVRSATCITEKKTGQLIDKLAHMAGQHNANVLEQKHRVYSVQKSHNENIFASRIGYIRPSKRIGRFPFIIYVIAPCAARQTALLNNTWSVQ